MSKECSVTVIPLEFLIVRGENLKDHPFIPASQLHKPGLPNQSVLKRSGKSLSQRSEDNHKLVDISNLQLNGCLKNLSEAKRKALVSTKRRENTAVTNQSRSAKQQVDEKKHAQPSNIRHSASLKRKIYTEHDRNFSKDENPSKACAKSRDEQFSDKIEQVLPAKRNRQIGAEASTEFLEVMPRRSKRARRQNYKLDYSYTFVIESPKKTQTCKKTLLNKPKKQGKGITTDSYAKRGGEERTQDGAEKISGLPVQQSTRKVSKTKRIADEKHIDSDKCGEDQEFKENSQSKSEHIEVRKTLRTRGRPPSVSVNMQLRRSTRQRKVNYQYLDETYIFDEYSSFLNKNKNQEFMKGKKNLVTDRKAAQSKDKNVSQKEISEKSIGDKGEENDKELTASAVSNREKEKNTFMNRCEEKSCKESKSTAKVNNTEKKESKSTAKVNNTEKKESKSSAKVNNTEKKTVQTSKEQSKRSKKSGKPQSDSSQSSEDCKITAKKGTLKYLHQREKYMTALTKEADGGDDLFENPFFAKKRFKFANLLPPSHEDTLIIKTPKRGFNEDQENAVFTPRTTMLGQLQPVTPTTQPYSPCPSLDSGTKKEALKQVYHWMNNKKRHPKRSGKVLHDTSRQNINFTPLELPAVPENQSGNESETMDEYFSDDD